ncbi:anaerobic ribonucleoside-triphosphate reductase [Bacillus licheniformis]|nr:anaerobic ribonucleoside-triphosphate reductase [Bacillus licheniformis]
MFPLITARIRQGKAAFDQNILKATKAGLGKGETPISDSDLQMKEGVNVDQTDPNYDLYWLALETSAERLFPNFSFIDSPVNKPFMTERRKAKSLIWDAERASCPIFMERNSVGRGNLSFTSINIVK